MATELTIEELAARVNMTVRNIRAHQSRGLLPPPAIVGRTGYYGPDHVDRLDRIRQLQDEGLNLAAIARVMDDGTIAAVATGPFADDEPTYADPDELVTRLGLSADDPVVARTVAMGLVTPVSDGQVRVEVPRLVAIAEQLAELGVPLEAMLDVVEVVQQASASVARSYMQLVDEHLVATVLADTGGDLDQLTKAVERLQTQASGTIDILFNRAMASEIRAYLTPPAERGGLEPEAGPGA